MPSDNSLLKRLKQIAEEVEAMGAEFKDATTHRTKEGKITLAFVEPFEDQ